MQRVEVERHIVQLRLTVFWLNATLHSNRSFVVCFEKTHTSTLNKFCGFLVYDSRIIVIVGLKQRVIIILIQPNINVPIVNSDSFIACCQICHAAECDGGISRKDRNVSSDITWNKNIIMSLIINLIC